jgi:hypothetical protein
MLKKLLNIQSYMGKLDFKTKNSEFIFSTKGEDFQINRHTNA